MGEYHTQKNSITGKIEPRCKLGSMDDWRYVRRAEAQFLSLSDTGKGTDIKVALCESSILWRFPWPWEDQPEPMYQEVVDAINKRDMFKTMALYPPAMPGDFEHSQKVIHIKPDAAGTGVNLWLPCPLNLYDFRMSSRPYPCVSVYGERYTNGVPRTIFQCGWCDTPFALNEAELVMFRGNLENYREPWQLEVIKRFQPSR